MHYKDMKEMTFKEWDGQPFLAYVCDNDGEEVSISRIIVQVCGYFSEGEYPWHCNGVNYAHAYPIEWNKAKFEEALNPKPKKVRMTNRQLAMWLAKGNGQMMHLSHVDLSVEETACVYTSYFYYLVNESFECDDRIRVRKLDSEKWVEPTVDLLED